MRRQQQRQAEAAALREFAARLESLEFPTPAERDSAELALVEPRTTAQAELPLQGAA